MLRLCADLGSISSSLLEIVSSTGNKSSVKMSSLADADESLRLLYLPWDWSDLEHDLDIVFLSFFNHQAPSLEDFSHLPPEQRRKRLQQRIDELNKELQKEMDQR